QRVPPAPDAELAEMITCLVHVSLFLARWTGGAPVRKGGQGAAERQVETQAGLAVAAGRAAVDDRDRDSLPGRMPDEPVAGHDGQRGAQHEQRPGLADQLVALVDP